MDRRRKISVLLCVLAASMTVEQISAQTSRGCYSQVTHEPVPCSNPAPTPPPPPSGSVQNSDGIAAYEKSDYDRAIQFFSQAYSMSHDPKYKMNEMHARAVKAHVQAVNLGAQDWNTSIRLLQEALNNASGVPGLPAKEISDQLDTARALRLNALADRKWADGDHVAAVQLYTEANVMHPGRIVGENLDYARKIADLESRIERTRRAMTRLEFRNGQLNKDIDEWTALNRKAQQQAFTQIMDVAVTGGLQILKESFKAATPLAESDVARWRGVFPSFEGSPLQRAAAEAYAHMMAVKTYGQLAGYFEKFGTTSDIAAKAGAVALEPKDLMAWGELSASTLEIFIHDPLLLAILADVKIYNPVLYEAGVALTWLSVDAELSRVGLGQYAEASALTRMYRADLEERRIELDSWHRSQRDAHSQGADHLTHLAWGVFPFAK